MMARPADSPPSAIAAPPPHPPKLPQTNSAGKQVIRLCSLDPDDKVLSLAIAVGGEATVSDLL